MSIGIYVEHESTRVLDGKWYLIEEYKTPIDRAQKIANNYKRRTKIEMPVQYIIPMIEEKK